jgi:antirestriction protein ArdC
MTFEVLSEPKSNVHATITRKIVAMIEAGVGTYKTPWHTAGVAAFPTNAATHREYRGINVVALWAEAAARGYASGLWASYLQWKGLGAQVRKGERGALIVFYKRAELTPTDTPNDDAQTELQFFARASYVFNAVQVDGYEPPPIEMRSGVERVQEADAFVEAVGAHIRHGFSMACYRRKADHIEMPHPDSFVGSNTSSPTESYYATLLHELTHWSGAPHRLNRDFGKRFGEEAYAIEELTAELGAAFLCSALGIVSEPRPDHASYVASWLAVLKRDSRAIFSAARKAQEAFEHLAYLAMRSEITDRAETVIS